MDGLLFGKNNSKANGSIFEMYRKLIHNQPANIIQSPNSKKRYDFFTGNFVENKTAYGFGGRTNINGHKSRQLRVAKSATKQRPAKQLVIKSSSESKDFDSLSKYAKNYIGKHSSTVRARPQTSATSKMKTFYPKQYFRRVGY